MRGSAPGLLAAPFTPESLADRGSSGEEGERGFLTGPFRSGAGGWTVRRTEDGDEQASPCCSGRAREAGRRL